MKCLHLDLGLLPYETSFLIQGQILECRMAGWLPNTLILQENLPVITIGRSGNEKNIRASAEELMQRGIQVVGVNRGGDVTYHGPGQLIVSPVFLLADIALNANQFMHRLEDVMLRVLADYDIAGEKKAGLPGVWVNDEKIGSVGLGVKNGVTFHGFSLNVCVDLSPFTLINPCGIPSLPVTSMARQKGLGISVEEITLRVRNSMATIFGLEFEDTELGILQSMIIESRNQ